MNNKKRLAAIVIFNLVIVLSLYLGLRSSIHRSHKSTCTVQLNTYNKHIESLGVHKNVSEIWADPEKTQEYVAEDFPHVPFPLCPSGGELVLVYSNAKRDSLPRLACSLEGSHGHGSRAE